MLSLASARHGKVMSLSPSAPKSVIVKGRYRRKYILCPTNKETDRHTDFLHIYLVYVGLAHARPNYFNQEPIREREHTT